MNKQLGDLISRMTELEKLYIPSEEDQLGDYSSTDEDNARAYTLLAHAEIMRSAGTSTAAACHTVLKRFFFFEERSMRA